MPYKKIKELRELNNDELIKLKNDLSKELLLKKFKLKIERPQNLMERRFIRKTIARINTILRERELLKNKENSKNI